MMTRKHFTAVAEILGDALADGLDVETIDALTEDLADLFAADNPRFNRDLFGQHVHDHAEYVRDTANLVGAVYVTGDTDDDDRLVSAHGPWGIDPVGA